MFPLAPTTAQTNNYSLAKNKMGAAASALLTCRRLPELRVLIFGLNTAGKTCLLYRLKTGQMVRTIPTVGFNVESIGDSTGRVKRITMWDIGGGDKIRGLYRHYFSNMNGVLYLVDGVDQEQLSESIDVLIWLCSSLDSEGLQDLPVAVLCNKSDLNPGMVAETCSKFNRLTDAEVGRRTRPYRCFEISVATGASLSEAMDWLIGAALHDLTLEL